MCSPQRQKHVSPQAKAVPTGAEDVFTRGQICSHTRGHICPTRGRRCFYQRPICSHQRQKMFSPEAKPVPTRGRSCSQQGQNLISQQAEPVPSRGRTCDQYGNQFSPVTHVEQGFAMIALPPSISPATAGKPNPSQPSVLPSMAPVSTTGEAAVSRLQYSL